MFEEQYEKVKNQIVDRLDLNLVLEDDFGYKYESAEYVVSFIRAWSGLHKMFIRKKGSGFNVPVLVYSGNMPETMEEFKTKYFEFLERGSSIQFLRECLFFDVFAEEEEK